MKFSIFIVLFLSAIGFSEHIFGQQSKFTMASEQYYHGSLDSAIVLYTEAINQGVEVNESYIMRAACKGLTNNLEGSLDDLNVARTTAPNYYKIQYYYGRAYLLNMLYDKAILHFDSCISLNKQFYKAFVDRGDALFRIGKVHEGISDVLFAADHDRDANSYSDLGYMYFTLKMFDSSLLYLNLSIALRPSQKAYANRGLLAYAKGDFLAAVADLSKALNISQNRDPDILFLRGQSYRALHNKEKACADLQESKALGNVESKALSKEYCE